MGNSSSSPNFSFNNNKSQEESRVNKCTRHLNCSLLRSPSLILICASSFLQTLGWLVPFTYLSGTTLFPLFLFRMINLGEFGLSSRRPDGPVKGISCVPSVLGRDLRHRWSYHGRLAGRLAKGGRIGGEQRRPYSRRSSLCDLPILYHIRIADHLLCHSGHSRL